jgi:hypothetical protein
MIDDFGDQYLGLFDSQLAGLDLGKVQHIVDDAEQALAGSLNLGEGIACLGSASSQFR